MSTSKRPAAPTSGTSLSKIPAFDALAADPEIAPLLESEPVPRKIERADGWTPELQRELIARLAVTGTLQAATWQMDKRASGAKALYRVATAESFRASWDAAIAIGRRRAGLDVGAPYAGAVPGGHPRGEQSASSPQRDDWGAPEEPTMSDDQRQHLLAEWHAAVHTARGHG